MSNISDRPLGGRSSFYGAYLRRGSGEPADIFGEAFFRCKRNGAIFEHDVLFVRVNDIFRCQRRL